MDNNTLLLEEIKGMRVDMNQHLQALQMLFSEHLKSITTNHQKENGTLEQDDSIQTQMSTNDVVDVDLTMIKSEIVENCEALAEGSIQISHYESLYKGGNLTTENNPEREIKLEFSEPLLTPADETLSSQSLFEGNSVPTKDLQETDNLLVDGEKDLIPINGLERNDLNKCSNDLQRQETTTAFIPTNNVKLVNQGDNKVSNYVCWFCNKFFYSEPSLIEHAKNCTAKHCGNSQMRMLKRLDKINFFKCGHCNQCFKNPRLLKTHLKKHADNIGDKPYKCDICQKTFAHLSHFKSHLRIHTGEKPFKCEYCSKLFSRYGTLKKHLIIHTNEKPFSCEFCPKFFSRSDHLKLHATIHTGDKTLYKCEFCPKTFSRFYSLKRHVQRHTGKK